MNELNDILPDDFDNLEKYAPTLLKVGRRDGFVVPENYFETLPGHLQSLLTVVNAAKNKTAGLLVDELYFTELKSRIEMMLLIATAARNKQAGLSDPGENYFETLTSQIELLNRLHEISGNKTPYELPAAYFEELGEELKTKLALDNLKQDQDHLFPVPEGYFEQLVTKMKSFAALEQMKQGNASDVPEGYFNDFASRVQARIEAEEKTTAPEKGKVIPLFAHVSKNARSYSAAAALLLVLGAGWVWYRSVNNTILPGESLAKNDSSAPKIKQQNNDTTKQVIIPQQVAKNNNINPNPEVINDTTNQQPDKNNNPLVKQDIKKDSVKTDNNPQYAVNNELPAEFDNELRDAAIDYLVNSDDDLGDLLDEIGMMK